MTRVCPDRLAAANMHKFAATNKWEDCKRYCPHPDVILDCGANIGQTVANLRQAYPQATIYCFEPVKSLCEELRRRAGSLRIQVEQLAVSCFNGPATMHLTASPESNSLLPFLENGNPLAESHEVLGLEHVRVVRLDDWCRSMGMESSQVDILKMDVQGSELDALRGAAAILKTVKLVLLEVAFVRFYQGCPLYDEINRFMISRGFECHALYATPRPEVWADAMYIPAERQGTPRKLPGRHRPDAEARGSDN